MPSHAQAAEVTAPSWVEELSATASTTSITLKFKPPASNGGDANLKYQTSLDSGATWADLTTATGTDGFITGTITGLASSKSYNIQVAAVNSAGRGVGSSTTASTTAPAATVPTTVLELSATAASTSITVKFRAPSSDGGAPISKYQSSTDAGATWKDLSTTTGGDGFISGTLTGLTSSKSYTIQIAAVNSAGRGASASTTTSTTAPPLPKAPTIVSMRSTGVDGSSTRSDVTIEWELDNSVSPGSVSYYEVQYTSDGNWLTYKGGITIDLSTNRTFSSLVVGTEYSFRVAVVVSGTQSDWSTVYKGLVKGAPELASQVVATRSADYRSARITFTAPAVSPARPAGSSYVQYRVSGATTWIKSSNAVNSVVTLNDLIPESAYEYRIVSSNTIGAVVTGTSEMRGLKLPGAPESLAVSGQNTTATLKWNGPRDTGSSSLLGFDISTDGGQTWRDSAAVAGANGSYSVEIKDISTAGASVSLASRTADGRSAPITIRVASQSLTLNTLTDVSIRDKTKSLVITNAAATYTVSPDSVCTLSGSTISLKSEGTCTVSATMAGSTASGVVILPVTVTGGFQVIPLPRKPLGFTATYTGRSSEALGTKSVEIVWKSPLDIPGDAYILVTSIQTPVWLEHVKHFSFKGKEGWNSVYFTNIPQDQNYAELCFGTDQGQCTDRIKIAEPLEEISLELKSAKLTTKAKTALKEFALKAQASRKVITISVTAGTSKDQTTYISDVKKLLTAAGYTLKVTEKKSTDKKTVKVTLSVKYDK